MNRHDMISPFRHFACVLVRVLFLVLFSRDYTDPAVLPPGIPHHRLAGEEEEEEEKW